MARRPVVADRFYPGDPAELERMVRGFSGHGEEVAGQEALLAISPHAGYIYSGSVAGETFARIAVPEVVVILGPNHHGQGRSLALGTEAWDMPFGTVPVEQELASSILQRSELIVADETAHQYEHSLEVQVPFLQYRQKNLSIVPIVVSHLSFARCQRAAKDLALAINEYERPVLLVASTDMTHYESRFDATRKDGLALAALRKLDPAGLYETVVANRISMCGIMPTTIALLTALELGATRMDLVRYTDSGEVSGDTDQVVGYAGLIAS